MPFRRRHPSPAMLVALLALVLAVTGTAAAAVLISSPDQLADRVVTEPKLAQDSVGSRVLKEPGVFVNNLNNGAVTNPKLAASSVDGRALAFNTVNSSHLADRGVFDDDLRNPIFSASVSADGTTSTARSTGIDISQTRRLSEGAYQVAFRDDIRNCAITATPNSVGGGAGLLFSPTMQRTAANPRVIQLQWFAQLVNGGRTVSNDTTFSVMTQC